MHPKRRFLAPTVCCSCLLISSMLLSGNAETSPHQSEQNISVRKEARVDGQASDRTLASATGESVSGCLLLRDESHLIAEWVAYHYHVLPLRHLIVSIDPVSLSSPLEILNRFTEDLGDGFEPMTLEVWDESVYNTGHEFDFNDPNFDEGNGIHNNRQRRFVRECARFHKDHGRTWVIVVDPDEFVTLNTVEEDDPKVTEVIEQGSWILEQLPAVHKKYYQDGRKYNETEMQKHRPDLWIERQKNIADRQSRKSSSFPRQGKFVDVMRQSPWIRDSCTVMPRLLFVSIESPEEVVSRSNAGMHGFDPMKFRTQRYFHHDQKGTQVWGKCIVDISRTPYNDLIEKPENVHTPFPRCGYPVPRYEESIFRVHHYLGTFEEYMFGGDCRRTREVFDEKCSTAVGANYDLQYWIGDFVDEIGIDKARYLLESAGIIPDVDRPDSNCIETV